MTRFLKRTALALLVLLALASAALAWYVHSKQPQRSGTVAMSRLQAPVDVRYDERGVPHIQAANETDMYRALGYVHAQDRLFQMEVARRLARGELAEILGPKLVDTDRLFRTLSLRAHADATIETIDKTTPAYRAALAYLDGVNQYQAGHPAPIEFDILGIPKRPFTPQDTLAVAGYLAFSFASAFKTEPVMTYIRDGLGARYLADFDQHWYPRGVDTPAAMASMGPADWHSLERVTALVRQVMDEALVPPFEGSNAWAIAGSRTASGKPMLAGDPHIGFSTPAVWYEVHLRAPGMELYGHFQVLNPLALLGHNQRFGWSLTMFQNDDVDMVVEKVNPDNAGQVWHQGRWVDLQQRSETIKVKGAPPVVLQLRRSPHGPIITDAYPDNYGSKPVAMWWTFLEAENPILDAFYALNRADTLDKARHAASLIHAPGLNVVWANADGDIGWWAAAKLPIRPPGVNPTFLLDASKGEAEKPGFHPFADNPQQENPKRGFIVSANHQPTSGIEIPGYYHPPDRVQRLVGMIQNSPHKADVALSQVMQRDVTNGYARRVLTPLLPVLQGVVTDPVERKLLDQLAVWDGSYTVDKLEPTVFVQLLYGISHAAMFDELGEVQFKNLLGSRSLDFALPRLVANADSPWWDDKRTDTVVETRADMVRTAWRETMAHLRSTLGTDVGRWAWGRAHTLTHNHPLGQQKPLDKLFSVGPFAAPGGRELPNALGTAIGPAPWAVTYGPSTRRVIDFANPGQALGINPVGQSGVLFDAHYSDQAATYSQGGYVREWLADADVVANTRSSLQLRPVARP